MGFHLLLSGLLLLCLQSCSLAHARRVHHQVVQVRTLVPAAAHCSPISTGTSNRTNHLPIVSLGSPCNSSAAAFLSDLLRADEARVSNLRGRLLSQPSAELSSSSSSSLPTRPGTSLGSGNYLVTISLGTPKRELTVIFDTGSDLTWVQCQPCLDHCHPQADPLFDPSLSSSFSNVSCPSTACSSLLSATGNSPTCASSLCLYSVKYGDGSYSVGILSRDTLTLPTADVPNFLFGCGHSNDGLFGRTSGLLGLGRDPISAVSQSPGPREFSYCLPTPSSVGHLTFGDASSSAAYTPMLTDPTTPSLYFLDLVAIKVGGVQLPVPSTVFQQGGTIIDSGTVITRLPPAAYAALKTAFRLGMRRYRQAAAYLILDTCFDLRGYKSVKLPAVALLFRGGAALHVPAEGLLVGPSSAQLCLAFAGNENAADVGIIGNKQQMTVEVVYDIDNARIGFASGGCS